MENSDRTLEMPASPFLDADGQVKPEADVTDEARTSRAAVYLSGEDTTLTGDIPQGLEGRRPSPALDPNKRMRVSRTAKWLLLVGILLFVAYIPLSTYASNKALFFLLAVASATVFSAVIATALPRAFLPGVFGKWHEAVEAFRDWMVVGLLTGGLYLGLIAVARALNIGPGEAETNADWLAYRLPLLFISGAVALLVSRLLAIRSSGLVGGGGAGSAVWQIALQGALLALMERPIEKALFYQAQTPYVPLAYGLAALACAGTAIGITLWAATVDAGLVNPQRKRRGMTGITGGAQPVDLTLTVIGGRESGKTVLLAAAFYEWTTQNVGNLRITPTPDPDGRYEGGTNLEEVARDLYVENHFPVGTVSTRNLPFDLALGKDSIARFNFLDYPGGALAGHGADSEIVKEFWDRVDDTDGLVLIADMSYVRRSQKDSDWIDVRNAYRTVMQRVVDRNGKRRVVPVALVLTKCDEYINMETGQLDKAAIEAGLKEFQYDELETEWRQLNADRGPGFTEFRTFITSAITYSEPQTDAYGRPDMKKPFVIPPPPPNITPAGCASPLLWMSSKVMRWNVTLFADLGTFLYGSSPRVRRRVEAVLEMERIADQRAGKG